MENDIKDCSWKSPLILKGERITLGDRIPFIWICVLGIFIFIFALISIKEAEINFIFKILLYISAGFFFFYFSYSPLMYLFKIEIRKRAIIITPIIWKEREISILKINKIKFINIANIQQFFILRGKVEFKDLFYFLPMSLGMLRSNDKIEAEEFVKCINEWISKEKEKL